MKQANIDRAAAPDVSDDRDVVAKPGLATRFLPLVILLLALLAALQFELHKYLDINLLRENREALSNWVAGSPLVALAIFVAIYAGAVAISLPGASILTIFGGFLFGLWPGVPAIVVAATIGATIVFVASKTALGDVMRDRAGGLVARMEKGFREDELNYMFLLRLAPVFPFWAVNIGAGVLGVSFRNFMIGTFFGIIPGSFVYASIGNAAGAAFDQGENPSLAGVLTQPETLLPIAGLILLALTPILLKRFGGKRAAAALSD